MKALEPRVRKAILVGYTSTAHKYKLLYADNGTYTEHTNVTFDETDFIKLNSVSDYNYYERNQRKRKTNAEPV